VFLHYLILVFFCFLGHWRKKKKERVGMQGDDDAWMDGWMDGWMGI